MRQEGVLHRRIGGMGRMPRLRPVIAQGRVERARPSLRSPGEASDPALRDEVEQGSGRHEIGGGVEDRGGAAERSAVPRPPDLCRPSFTKTRWRPASFRPVGQAASTVRAEVSSAGSLSTRVQACRGPRTGARARRFDPVPQPRSTMDCTRFPVSARARAEPAPRPGRRREPGGRRGAEGEPLAAETVMAAPDPRLARRGARCWANGERRCPASRPPAPSCPAGGIADHARAGPPPAPGHRPVAPSTPAASGTVSGGRPARGGQDR